MPESLDHVLVGGVGGQINQLEFVLHRVKEKLQPLGLVRGSVVKDNPDFSRAPEHSQHALEKFLEILPLESLHELNEHAPRFRFHNSDKVHTLPAGGSEEHGLVPLLDPHPVYGHHPLDAQPSRDLVQHLGQEIAPAGVLQVP